MVDGILPSCLVSFFCSAPGGAILPSRPARWCGRRAQRRSRTAPPRGRPEGLSLTAASTAAGWCAPTSAIGDLGTIHHRANVQSRYPVLMAIRVLILRHEP